MGHEEWAGSRKYHIQGSTAHTCQTSRHSPFKSLYSEHEPKLTQKGLTTTQVFHLMSINPLQLFLTTLPVQGWNQGAEQTQQRLRKTSHGEQSDRLPRETKKTLHLSH